MAKHEQHNYEVGDFVDLRFNVPSVTKAQDDFKECGMHSFADLEITRIAYGKETGRARLYLDDSDAYFYTDQVVPEGTKQNGIVSRKLVDENAKGSEKMGEGINKNIIELYPNTKDAVLVNKFFANKFNDDFDVAIVLSEKKDQILDLAKAKQAELDALAEK